MNNDVKSNKWIYVRLAVILIGIVSGITFHESEPSKDEWIDLLAGFLFGLFASIALILFQAINPYSDEKWFKVSWRHCPFNLRQPLQPFHLLMLFSISSGSAMFLKYKILREREFFPLLILVSGIGFWFGIHFIEIILRRKIIKDNE